jgi:hypothetical protein
MGPETHATTRLGGTGYLYTNRPRAVVYCPTDARGFFFALRVHFVT